MCTIGVTRLGSDDYLVFKNKDFPRASFEDQLVVEPEVFGISGVATWSEPGPAADVFSGMSVGANGAGLLCADANVRGASGLANYDELVEIALRAGGGVAAAVAAIDAAVAARPYLWGNIILIDGTAAATVEVRGAEVAMTPRMRPAAAANHHVVLGAPHDDAGSPTTELRLQAAQKRLNESRSLGDVLALQRAHDDGETGVCNHVESQTIYSYVLRRNRGETALYVTQGHPCRSGEPAQLLVPLGELWSEDEVARFRSAYPSAREARAG